MILPVVVDTNVVVAGLLTARDDSPVARVLDGMLAAAWPFVLSEALLAEYRTVLLRPRLRSAHGLDENEIDTLLLEIGRHAIVLEPAPTQVRAPDPGDQHLWDLLHARADLHLVTGDMRLHAAAGADRRILTAQAFLDRIGNQGGPMRRQADA